MDVDKLQAVLSEHKAWRDDKGGKQADLRGADLRGADLRGAFLNWQSHDLLAEILRRAAGGHLERRMVAGLILVSRDWCWDDFAKLVHPEKQWAMAALAEYIKEGDDLPKILREIKESVTA